MVRGWNLALKGIILSGNDARLHLLRFMSNRYRAESAWGKIDETNLTSGRRVEPYTQSLYPA